MSKKGVIVFIITLLFVIIGLNDMQYTNRKTQQEIIERTLYDAMVQCYALEGMYPEDVEYLKKHYGLQINDEEYFIYYESIGPNIMPNIKVIIKE